MRKYIGLILISMAILQFSCTEEDEIIRCDAQPNISESLYGTTSSSVTITGASILTNCLEIRFSYTGCTDVATYDLAVSEIVSDTYPPNRAMRIVLSEEGNCSITQSQTYRVDLTILQVEDTSRLNLELEGWGEPLVYGY
ncbi:hypothetical protein [Lunatibacter salilacus]|uniref:hypothetical protein n=1 Tax=Lunatibacter salilacus TaxID=2483804 RepID=UPI00131D7D1D|nr:hypothetical protein [Lunatibacter salilacus]